MTDKPTFYIEPETPFHGGPPTMQQHPSGLIGPAEIAPGNFVEHPREPGRSEGEPQK